MNTKGKQQSERLTAQQKAADGVIGIFEVNAQQHDKEVCNTSAVAMALLEKKFPEFWKFHADGNLFSLRIVP